MQPLLMVIDLFLGKVAKAFTMALEGVLYIMPTGVQILEDKQH